MLASIVHILPLTLIRRERLLPIPGKVLVRQGQRVAPKDVIARANIAPEHLLLNIAHGLGISSKEADQVLQRAAGDDVTEGDLLAGPVGLTRRVVRAPRSGRIVLAGEGQLLMEVESAPFELRAGLGGVVTQLMPDRGAVIETTGALIQGVWGNGRLDFGLMQSKIQSPDDRLTATHLDVSLRGGIILGGYCEDPQTLRNAADIPLRGLILASMSASLVPLASRMPFPLLVVNGFGQLSMDKASYNLLTTNQNREVSILAEPFDRFRGTRPEVVISLPATEDSKPTIEAEEFAVQQQVRIVRSPFATAIARIKSLHLDPTNLPSGIRAPAATVNLESGEDVIIPLANLEVMV